MAKVTKLKDPSVEMTITGTVEISATSTDFLDLVRALSSLHSTIPMVSYDITRTGLADEWVVSATAADTRVYATTVTMVAGVAKYTLTSLPAGTAPEVSAFLALIQVFARYLKPYEVTTVAIAWG